MRYWLTIVLTVLLLFSRNAGKGQSALDLKPLGIGAYSRSFVSPFSGLHNQAALADLEYFTAGAFIRQRFSLKALSTVQFSAALPVEMGTFGFQGSVQGYKYFKKQRLKAVYARKLFQWLNIGAELDYLTIRIPTYGHTQAVTFALSALFHIHKQWHAGVQIFNPGKVHYQKLGNDPIPDVYLIGLGYQPSDLFLCTTELRYYEHKADLLVAFRYHIAPILIIKAGFSTGTVPVFAGLQLYLKKIRILLSAHYHQRLGLSPGAGFIFENKPADAL